MEADVLKEMVPNAVSAVAVIVVVVLFLKHLASERKLDRDADERTAATIDRIAASCHDSTSQLAQQFTEKIAKMDEREEERRRELAAQYDRDRREMASALAAFTAATQAQNTILTNNGSTLQAIAGELQKGVHPRIREKDYRKAVGGA